MRRYYIQFRASQVYKVKCHVLTWYKNHLQEKFEQRLLYAITLSARTAFLNRWVAKGFDVGDDGWLEIYIKDTNRGIIAIYVAYRILHVYHNISHKHGNLHMPIIITIFHNMCF
jgi:hypothetical protein